MTKFILIGILSLFFSCKNNERINNLDKGIITSSEKKNEVKTLIRTEKKSYLNKACNLEKFLKNPKTPKLAKELFDNKAKNDDRALEYFENLKSTDKTEREFYFKVLTNLYKIADGSTGEGLGYSGLEYVENNTLDFLSYFENRECFSDNDLKTWAKILMLEFELVFENKNDVEVVQIFISKINLKSKSCNASQKKTLEKFTDFLTEEWKINLPKK